MMEIVRDASEMRAVMGKLQADGANVALVPTMGALHAGHLSLVEAGLRDAGKCVASLFVNPKQFGPNEDFSRYPRQEAADIEILRAAGCDVLFAPAPETVYPSGFATTVSVAHIGDTLEGAHRPGHFDGVSTIVAKLLLMVLPDIAIFGEKDWQQLAIIRRMAADLNLPVRILGAPTVRDNDGLALSSRNTYLSATERTAAAALPAALLEAKRRIEAGDAVPPVLAQASNALLNAGFSSVDYVTLADADSLQLLAEADRPARLLAAARIGATRLIDNFPVEPRG